MLNSTSLLMRTVAEEDKLRKIVVSFDNASYAISVADNLVYVVKQAS